MLEEGRIKDYKDLLKKAFPKALENDTDAVLDIIPFDENEIKAFDPGLNDYVGKRIFDLIRQ